MKTKKAKNKKAAQVETAKVVITHLSLDRYYHGEAKCENSVMPSNARIETAAVEAPKTVLEGRVSLRTHQNNSLNMNLSKEAITKIEEIIKEEIKSVYSNF